MQKKNENLAYTNLSASFLTKISHNKLDWFNVAGLARQRTQESIAGLWNHYSWRELMIRGGMIGFSVMTAYYGGKSSDVQNDFSLTSAAVYGGLGFLISHSMVIIPTLQRRNSITTASAEYLDKIYSELSFWEYNELAILITERVGLIASYNFPALKKGDAVLNLIRKKTIMENILAELSVHDNEFWMQDISVLINHFLNGSNVSVCTVLTKNPLG